MRKQPSAFGHQRTAESIPLVDREIDDDDSPRLFVRAFKFPLLHRLHRALFKHRASAHQFRKCDRAARSDNHFQPHFAAQSQFFCQRGSGRQRLEDYLPRNFLGQENLRMANEAQGYQEESPHSTWEDAIKPVVSRQTKFLAILSACSLTPRLLGRVSFGLSRCSKTRTLLYCIGSRAWWLYGTSENGRNSDLSFEFILKELSFSPTCQTTPDRPLEKPRFPR